MSHQEQGVGMIRETVMTYKGFTIEKWMDVSKAEPDAMIWAAIDDFTGELRYQSDNLENIIYKIDRLKASYPE